MQTILLVADRQSVIDQVHTALTEPDAKVIDHADSSTAADVAYEQNVDAVVVDMQVGSMGAMAVTRAIRGRSDDGVGIPVTILLDRDVDAFLAGRAGARNWLTKDAPASDLRDAVGATTAST